MNRPVFPVLACVFSVACVKPAVEAAPMEARVAPVAAAGEPLPAPPPDAPRDVEARFPAGPGVSLLADQLQAVVRDPRIRDAKVPFAERLAIAEQLLGKGEEIHESSVNGFAWRGVGARTVNAPFGCSELVVSSTQLPWLLRPADHKKCGLPYAADPTMPYRGPAPKRTAYRFDEVLGEAATKAPAAAVAHAVGKLGAADFHGENGEEMWAGMAPRGREAPITCRVLYLGGRPRIEDAPLASCNLSWPMPGMTFDPGPEVPPIDKDAKLADCRTKCGANDICMIDQRVPSNATVHHEPDGERARFPDGRAAKTELVASCVPVPPTCSPVNASCFFPSPMAGHPMPSPAQWNGPCPVGVSTGHAFVSSPSPHIMCFSRVGGVPRPPPPSPPPRPSGKPATTPSPAPTITVY